MRLTKHRAFELLEQEIRQAWAAGKSDDFTMGLYQAREVIMLELDRLIGATCTDCGLEEKSCGLDCCSSCYNKRIWG